MSDVVRLNLPKSVQFFFKKGTQVIGEWRILWNHLDSHYYMLYTLGYNQSFKKSTTQTTNCFISKTF